MSSTSDIRYGSGDELDDDSLIQDLVSGRIEEGSVCGTPDIGTLVHAGGGGGYGSHNDLEEDSPIQDPVSGCIEERSVRGASDIGTLGHAGGEEGSGSHNDLDEEFLQVAWTCWTGTWTTTRTPRISLKYVLESHFPFPSFLFSSFLVSSSYLIFFSSFPFYYISFLFLLLPLFLLSLLLSLLLSKFHYFFCFSIPSFHPLPLPILEDQHVVQLQNVFRHKSQACIHTQ